jgi:hypothetical protein
MSFLTSVRKFALSTIGREATPRTKLDIVIIHAHNLVLLRCRRSNGTEQQTLAHLQPHDLLENCLIVHPSKCGDVCFEHGEPRWARSPMNHSDVTKAK